MHWWSSTGARQTSWRGRRNHQGRADWHLQAHQGVDDPRRKHPGIQGEATEEEEVEADKAKGATKGTGTRHLQLCIMVSTIINIDMIVYTN